MPNAPTVLTATRDTLDILQTRRRFDVSDMINLLEPSRYPLLRLVGPNDDPRAVVKREVATDPEYRWFEDQLVPGRDRINNAGGYGAGAVSLVVANGSYFRAKDIIHIPRTGETMFVSTVTIATNTLAVTRSWGAVAAQALLDQDEIWILGTAMEEGSSNPDERTTLEVLGFNYIQEFRHPFSLTRTMVNTTLWTGKDMPYQSKKAGIEFGIKLERSFLFGERNQDSSGTTPRRTSGGIRSGITQNTLNLGGNPITEPVFENFCRRSFRYNAIGNNGVKFLVCSPLILSAVASWAKGRLLLNPEAKSYGMKIWTYASAHGTMELIPHWLFHDSDEYVGWGFLLDLPNIKVRWLQNCQEQMDTNIQLPAEHLRRDEYWGYMGWQVEQDDTHGVIRGVSGY